jgi:hypothetical protein
MSREEMLGVDIRLALRGNTNWPKMHKLYRAEVQALIHAANTIKEITLPKTQVVFLIDAVNSGRSQQTATSSKCTTRP